MFHGNIKSRIPVACVQVDGQEEKRDMTYSYQYYTQGRFDSKAISYQHVFFSSVLELLARYKYLVSFEGVSKNMSNDTR